LTIRCAIKQPLLCICDFCDFVWICDDFIRCPFCNMGNYHVVPIHDNKYLTMGWLDNYFLEHCVKDGGEKKWKKLEELIV